MSEALTTRKKNEQDFQEYSSRARRWARICVGNAVMLTAQALDYNPNHYEWAAHPLTTIANVACMGYSAFAYRRDEKTAEHARQVELVYLQNELAQQQVVPEVATPQRLFDQETV